MNKLLFSLKEFLILSKCPGCGCITKHSGTLCPDCMEKYEKEKSHVCPFCGMNAEKCFCSTEKLETSKEFGTSFSSIAFYGKDLTAVKDLIFTLKSSPDKNCEKFWADELSAFILDYFGKKGIDKSEFILTYPPRTKQSVKQYGFDHMKGLCRRVAEKTGMKFETVFSHRGRKIQKKLNSSERDINAKISFSILPGSVVKGKKYLIVDDVITSGSTVRRCEHLLKNHRAASYFAISLTRTVSNPVQNSL